MRYSDYSRNKRKTAVWLLTAWSMAATAAIPAADGATDTIRVVTTAGCAPQLPYQIKTTDKDGNIRLRQVRWTDSALPTEQREADTQATPAGSVYTVKGYILGDNTTPNGRLVVAQVHVTDRKQPVPLQVKAEPLPLTDVAITGHNRLTSNRELDTKALLALDITQQLYNYRDTYGLDTTGYTQADGWDAPTIKLKGHGSGHYMSALALAFASCQDKGQKKLLRQRMARMVNELRACQERTFVWSDSLGRYWEARDFAPEEELKRMKGSWADFDRYKKDFRHYGYGYLNAIPAEHPALIEMYRAYNNEDWVWAPYYSIHKQLAGLIDIATYTDDRKTARKALATARDMGLWVWNRLHYRTYVKADGSKEERRARPGNRYEMWNMYIAGEVGGMEESLARLAEMVDDKETSRRLLEAAACFDAPPFFNPLARNIDDIRNRHANQHIPMITGALRTYRLNADPYYYRLAQNFWTLVQGRYRYAPGGVGNGEMFRQPYAQMTSMTGNVTTGPDGKPQQEPTMNETCCAYNLAKLTKDLNCFAPDDARYMDYYERVLYNQIIGSVNCHHYQTTYQYAIGLNASKPFGNETPQSTCCGGTGAESHVKYQEAAYFASDSTLWVSLYLPTTARWRAQGITLEQQCEWPAQRSVLRITRGHATFSMKLRVPGWADGRFAVTLNGQPVASHYEPGSYVEIPRRRWTDKDVVEVTMPFTKYVDYGPDKVDSCWTGTLMYGPLAMTASGLRSWQEATVSLNGGLDGVGTPAPTQTDGTGGPLYTLTLGNKTLVPDYYAERGLTHYLRFEPSEEERRTMSLSTDVDLSKLTELADLAASRISEQQAWMDLSVKIPEYAPWAQHGMERLKTGYAAVRSALQRQQTQAEADRMASQLGTTLNAMRPGNLPELEDLQPLVALLEKSKHQKNTATKRQEAIAYAEMVVKYVSDGSGTRDMIQKAVRLLQEP